MKNATKVIAVIPFLFAFNCFASAHKSSTECKNEALSEAKKLLSFYRDNDERIRIDDTVMPLARMKTQRMRSNYSTFWKRGDTYTKGNTE